MRNKKETNSFPVIPVLLIVTLFGTLLFVNGIFESNVEVKEIVIEDNNAEMVLKYLEGPVSLTIRGFGSRVLVSKETDLVEAELLGVGNVLVLCEGIHFPKITNEIGLENSYEYRGC